MPSLFSFIRRYFISGLLFWLPIWATIMIVRFFMGLIDSSFTLLPQNLQPDQLLGFHVPGLGLIIIMIVILLSGFFVANFIGRRLVACWERIIQKIPLIRSIYTAIKQTVDTVFSSSGQSFRKVFLVQYPRAGVWSIAFQTGDVSHEVTDVTTISNMITLFIPTTPNPTSGYLIMVARSEAFELAMPVEQALKFVISLGVVQPSAHVPHRVN